MSKKKILAITTAIVAVVTALITCFTKKKEDKTVQIFVDGITVRKMGFYEKYIKRIFDIVCAVGAIFIFSPIYIIVAALVRINLGSPVVFKQDRPGLIGADGKETIFKMYKFRTMTDERDKNGELLPDGERLMPFGAWLRSTSLDELLEAFNILKGDMSIVGPRPQLVRDMVFMTDEQRKRHTVRPGLSGLAQVNGRNEIDWEERLYWDLEYIKKITFLGDIKIILQTVMKSFVRQEGITTNDMVTSEDYGDYLLRIGKVNQTEYALKQVLAKKILKEKSGYAQKKD